MIFICIQQNLDLSKFFLCIKLYITFLKIFFTFELKRYWILSIVCTSFYFFSESYPEIGWYKTDISSAAT